MPQPRNVFGEPLAPCSLDPLTGFTRSGSCESGPQDLGSHTICVQVTADFLEFSQAQGNDLSTPVAEYDFPGLLPGDRWCLCADRWREALAAGAAPIASRTSESGSTQSPSTLTPQCRCGPVERPVEPTRPIRCPLATCWPAFTSTFDWWR